VSVVTTEPETRLVSWRLVYAPGAGANIRDPFGTYAAMRLAEEGVQSARFQFPYQEAGSSRPGRGLVLEEAWRAVLDAVLEPDTQLVASGRSMGRRYASIVASKDASTVDALVLFAYPLHQPGHPEKARVAHRDQITVPTLFCSGTRDAFGASDELRDAGAHVPGSRLHLLDGADHGFAVLKCSRRTREEDWKEAMGALLAWAREPLDAG
jgi:predicted alpha/beta-hydrolase family hydrolase